LSCEHTISLVRGGEFENNTMSADSTSLWLVSVNNVQNVARVRQPEFCWVMILANCYILSPLGWSDDDKTKWWL